MWNFFFCGACTQHSNKSLTSYSFIYQRNNPYPLDPLLAYNIIEYLHLMQQMHQCLFHTAHQYIRLTLQRLIPSPSDHLRVRDGRYKLSFADLFRSLCGRPSSPWSIHISLSNRNNLLSEWNLERTLNPYAIDSMILAYEPLKTEGFVILFAAFFPILQHFKQFSHSHSLVAFTVFARTFKIRFFREGTGLS